MPAPRKESETSRSASTSICFHRGSFLFRLGFFSCVQPHTQSLNYDKKKRDPVRELSGHCTLPAEGRASMKVADGDGQSIGGIHWRGGSRQTKKPGHHVLHLRLFSAAITNYRRLYGEGGVFGDFKSGGSSGQHGYTSHLAELQRRLDVKGVKNIFNGYFVGLMFGNDFTQLSKNS